MTVSKIDILNRAFTRRMRGYDRAEVDAFMTEAAETVGDLTEDVAGLEGRVASLENALDEHRSREQTLRDTLVTTQKMIEDIKSQAQKEAQLILDAANAKAENMLNQAHLRLAQIHDDISELKKQRTQFEVKLRSILELHLKLMEQDKEEQAALEEAESKLKYLKTSGA